MICRKCHQNVPDGAYCIECGTRQDGAKRAPRRRGNGTGTAFKRGRTWTAQYTLYSYVEDVDGTEKRVRKYKTKSGFQTKKDALEYIDKLKNSETRKVPTLLELYLSYEKNDLPKLSKDKQTAYKKARERLEPIIGRKIDSLTTDDLQEVVNQNASTYYTARDMKTVLSKLYGKAEADKFVSSNLSKFIVLPDLKEKGQTPFSADEVDRMWKAFADGETFVGYMLVMIYSGMMPSELFALKKDMIDYDRCEIYGCGKKTKTRKDAPIVFADCIVPVLKLLEESSPTENIQPRYRSEWYDEYHAVLKRIGIRDLPPYSCRHTTGTEAAKQNLNAATIQKVMRHAKITTSQRYIHFGTDEAHTGINAINKKN